MDRYDGRPARYLPTGRQVSEARAILAGLLLYLESNTKGLKKTLPIEKMKDETCQVSKT